MTSSCSSSCTCKACGTKLAANGEAAAPTRARHPDAKCIESGRIYWFYRPRVELNGSHDFSEVQRLYFLLAPANSTRRRLFVMTSKTMPESRGHTRHWAFVDIVADKQEEIHDILDKKEYDTKTRGHRTVQSCRPAGEGVYELLWIASKPQSCLAYVLEVPSTPGDVQKAFHIEKEASYIMQVKNPEHSTEGAPGLGAGQKAHFPADLQQSFKGVRVESRKFIPVHTPEFLDFQHTEVLLIGESDDLSAEFGAVGQSLEVAEKQDEERLKKELNGHLEDAPYRDLGLSKDEFPSKPLTGKWEEDSDSKASGTKSKSKAKAKAKTSRKGGKSKAKAKDEDGDDAMEKESSKKGRGSKRYARGESAADKDASEPSPPKKAKWTGHAC